MTRRDIIDAAVAGRLEGSAYNGWFLRLPDADWVRLREEVSTAEVDGDDKMTLAYTAPGGAFRWVNVWRGR